MTRSGDDGPHAGVTNDEADDRLASLLSAFDGALKAGCPVEVLSQFVDGELTSQQRQRLLGAQQCVHWLDQLLRPATTAASGVRDDSQADQQSTARQDSAATAQTEPFRGTERFEVVRQIGAGAMGVVYEVQDLERGGRLALKILNRADAAGILLFKQEFRRLTNVLHDNLVVLHELIAFDDQWLLTMELIEGTDLLTALLSANVDIATDRGRRRLCSLLRQLVNGISSLHAAGIVHRDLKPSNVLVTAQDRVVIVDFGLATEFCWAGVDTKTSGEFAGTAAWMAPEQAACLPVTPAADWYSVGVMLFQVLAGRLPFTGPLVLLSRQCLDPPLVSDFVPDVLPAWDSLCRDLMARRAEDRPCAAQLIERLSEIETAIGVRDTTGEIEPEQGAALRADSTVPQPVSSSFPAEAAFVGRENLLAGLRTAMEAVRNGQPVVVPVGGPSGVGKTAVVEHFLHGLENESHSLVLRGRCYEHESVPHKILDALVDDLTRYLLQLDSAEVTGLLPHDANLLAQVFPVLKRLRDLSPISSSSFPSQMSAPPAADTPASLRRRAFAALAELLRRLASQVPLVLFIDDVHWGDLPSAAALADLMQNDDPPRVLLLLTFRDDVSTADDCLAALRLSELPPLATPAISNLSRAGAATFQRFSIDVLPLSIDEARELAGSLLTTTRRNSDSQTQFGNVTAPIPSGFQDAIAADSGGHPYFVFELVNQALTRPDSEPQTSSLLDANNRQGLQSLDQILWNRVQQLPEQARRLVETVAVAGHPIRLDLACKAASIDSIARRELNQLVADRLLRTSGPRWQDPVSTFHDRVRETIHTRVEDGPRLATHSRLADVLEEAGSESPDTLALHFDAAGRVEPAVRYYRQAAHTALDALAFERAAELFRRALEILPDDLQASESDAGTPPLRDAPAEQQYLGARPAGSEWLELQRELGEALALDGRGGEAAPCFLAAAELANPRDALELRRAAARQFCISGRTDEGRRLLRDILAAEGLGLQRHPLAILGTLLIQRARLRWRGLRYQLKPEETVDEQCLRKIDLMWEASSGLSFQEPVLVAALHTRGLRLTLESGEPTRMIRAISWEAVLAATAGARSRSRVARLLQEAEALAAKIDAPSVRGLVCLGEGGSAFLQVRMADAVTPLEEAVRHFSTSDQKSWWELTTARSLLAWSWMHLGDFQSLERFLDSCEQDAEDRGDWFLLSSLHSAGRPQLLLAADQPDEAQSLLDELVRRIPYEQFQQQHVSLLFSQAHIDLYQGQGRAGWHRFQKNWPRLRRSMQLFNQFARVTMIDLRGRCALAAYLETGDSVFLRHARRDASRLRREQGDWVRPFADRLKAGIAESRGDQHLAVTALQSAATGFRTIGFQLCEAAAKHRLGKLIGGDPGRELSEHAMRIFDSQYVRNVGDLQAVYSYRLP